MISLYCLQILPRHHFSLFVLFMSVNKSSGMSTSCSFCVARDLLFLSFCVCFVLFSQLEITEAHGVDAKGVLFIVLGLCSLLFCALIGEFSDPKPKPKRGSHASRVTKKRAAY